MKAIPMSCICSPDKMSKPHTRKTLATIPCCISFGPTIPTFILLYAINERINIRFWANRIRRSIRSWPRCHIGRSRRWSTADSLNSQNSLFSGSSIFSECICFYLWWFTIIWIAHNLYTTSTIRRPKRDNTMSFSSIIPMIDDEMLPLSDIRYLLLWCMITANSCASWYFFNTIIIYRRIIYPFPCNLLKNFINPICTMYSSVYISFFLPFEGFLCNICACYRFLSRW